MVCTTGAHVETVQQCPQSRRILFWPRFDLLHHFIVIHINTYLIHFTLGSKTDAAGRWPYDLHVGPPWFRACLPESLLFTEGIQPLQSKLWPFTDQGNREAFQVCGIPKFCWMVLGLPWTEGTGGCSSMCGATYTPWISGSRRQIRRIQAAPSWLKRET